MTNNNKRLNLILSQFSDDEKNIITKIDSFPRSSFPLHTHNFFEIEFIIEGHGTQIINGDKYKMKPGMLYFLSPSDSHEFHIKDNCSTLANISFSHNILPADFEKLLTNKQEEYIFYTKGEEYQYICQLFKSIHSEFINKQDNYESILLNYLSIILLIIARKAKQPLSSTDFSDSITRALSYIKLHFTENPSLKMVAEYSYLTPAHLTTMIKKKTGLSYLEYLTNLKISYAKKLLKSNNHSITEIVFACGFNSICNFNRVFKEKTHRSPSEYRKKYLK